MNHLTIIGNLTKTPETRTTQSGSTVCTFTVAVNRRGKDSGTDFFRVSAWNKLGESCQSYLDKGRKVAVVGRVSVSTYQVSDGTTRASLDVMAEEVEFLSPKGEDNPQQAAPAQQGWTQVDDDDLPWA